MKNIRPEFKIWIAGLIALLVFDGLSVTLKSEMNPFVLGLLIPWLSVAVLGFVSAWLGNLWASLYMSALTGFLHGMLITVLSEQKDIPQVFMGLLFAVLCTFTCLTVGFICGLFSRLIRNLFA